MNIEQGILMYNIVLVRKYIALLQNCYLFDNTYFTAERKRLLTFLIPQLGLTDPTYIFKNLLTKRFFL